LAKKPPPMQLYGLLPKKNCRKCGLPTCMAFALKLAAGEAEVEACPLLEPASKERLKALLAPPVKAIVIGSPPRSVKLGGEEVLYRHERRFLRPASIAVVLDDAHGPREVAKLAAEAEGYALERLGERLKVGLIAVRSSTGEPTRFAEAVASAAKATGLPLALCSMEPKVMEAGLKAAEGLRPLIYAADSSNLISMVELAARFNSSLTVHASSLDEAVELVGQVLSFGLEEVALDLTGPSLAETLSNMILARGLAVRRGVRELGLPLTAYPKAFALKSSAPQLMELLASSLMLLRYASLIFLEGLDPLRLAPLMTLRQAIYSDPQRPMSVKPGLYEVGEPTPQSPVLVTTNYALTFHMVREDAGASGVPCYMVVVDTEGLSVATSMAGGKLTAEKVAEAIKESKVEGRVAHKTLILPGRAAKLRADVERLSGWRTIVGPRESAELRSFLKGWPFPS